MNIAGSLFASPVLLAFFALLTSSTVGRAEATENMTPLLLAVQDAPIPFMGSDGQIHLVYELRMTNFSSADIAVEKVEVISEGATLQTLDTAAVAGRLQPAGQRESAGTLAKGTQALLFLNVALSPGAKVPADLSHWVSVRVSAAPPGHQEFSEMGGATTVDRQPVALIGPPLRGTHYISATHVATPHATPTLPSLSTAAYGSRNDTQWTGSKPMLPDESIRDHARSLKATPSLVSRC
jgi:hypothetical protein